MTHHGKCPKCEFIVKDVILEPIHAKAGSKTFNALCFICPTCETVISVQMDPLTLKNDLLKELK